MSINWRTYINLSELQKLSHPIDSLSLLLRLSTNMQSRWSTKIKIKKIDKYYSRFKLPKGGFVLTRNYSTFNFFYYIFLEFIDYILFQVFFRNHFTIPPSFFLSFCHYLQLSTYFCVNWFLIKSTHMYSPSWLCGSLLLCYNQLSLLLLCVVFHAKVD